MKINLRSNHDIIHINHINPHKIHKKKYQNLMTKILIVARLINHELILKKIRN